MRYFSRALIVMSILFSAGCQPSQQIKSQSDSVARKERILAAENISLKSELKNLHIAFEKQAESLKKSKEDYEKLMHKSSLDEAQLNMIKTDYTRMSQQLEDMKRQLAECQNMLESKDVPTLCQGKIEQQKALLAECEKQKREIEKNAEETADFLMKQVPEAALKEVETLTAENEKLKARIAELEKGVKDANH